VTEETRGVFELILNHRGFRRADLVAAVNRLRVATLVLN